MIRSGERQKAEADSDTADGNPRQSAQSPSVPPYPRMEPLCPPLCPAASPRLAERLTGHVGRTAFHRCRPAKKNGVPTCGFSRYFVRARFFYWAAPCVIGAVCSARTWAYLPSCPLRIPVFGNNGGCAFRGFLAVAEPGPSAQDLCALLLFLLGSAQAKGRAEQKASFQNGKKPFVLLPIWPVAGQRV